MKIEIKIYKPKWCGIRITLLFLGLTLTASFAQQAVVSAGADASGSDGTAAYSVGQVFFSVNNGSNGSENQGVQQLNIENALPVTLVSFEATVKENEGVLLRWTTSFELNNDYFAIERSTDGRNFRALTKVSGKGNKHNQNNYESIDYFPYPGHNYYRLKQTDYDGSFGYSRIRVVNVIDSKNEISAYPNPTTDYLNIRTTGLKTENLTFQIITMNGTILRGKKLPEEAPVVDLRGLSPAVYFVTVLEENKAVKTFKIIKD
jgi:hypothetical protein